MWNNGGQSYGYGQPPPTSQPPASSRAPYTQSSMQPPAPAANPQPPLSGPSTNANQTKSPTPQVLSLDDALKKRAAADRIERDLAAAMARRRLGQTASSTGSQTAPHRVVKRPQQTLSRNTGSTATSPSSQRTLATLPGRLLAPAPAPGFGGPGPVSYIAAPPASARDTSGRSRPVPFRPVGVQNLPPPPPARRYPPLAMDPPAPQRTTFSHQHTASMSQMSVPPLPSNQFAQAFAQPAQVDHRELERQPPQREQHELQRSLDQAREANFARKQNGGWFH